MKGRSVSVLRSQVEQGRGKDYDGKIQRLESKIEQQNALLDKLMSKSTSVDMDMSPIVRMLKEQNQMITRLLSVKQAPPSVTVSNDKCGYKFEIQRDNRGRISEMNAYPVNTEGKY